MQILKLARRRGGGSGCYFYMGRWNCELHPVSTRCRLAGLNEPRPYCIWMICNWFHLLC